MQMIPFLIVVTRSKFQEPILQAGRSKALVCGRSLPGIADSNPAEGMNVSYTCCVLSGKDFCDGPIRRPEVQRSPTRCVCACVFVSHLV
jgi:hypothetical protein